MGTYDFAIARLTDASSHVSQTIISSLLPFGALSPSRPWPPPLLLLLVIERVPPKDSFSLLCRMVVICGWWCAVGVDRFRNYWFELVNFTWVEYREKIRSVQRREFGVQKKKNSQRSLIPAHTRGICVCSSALHTLQMLMRRFVAISMAAAAWRSGGAWDWSGIGIEIAMW